MDFKVGSAFSAGNVTITAGKGGTGNNTADGGGGGDVTFEVGSDFSATAVMVTAGGGGAGGDGGTVTFTVDGTLKTRS